MKLSSVLLVCLLAVVLVTANAKKRHQGSFARALGDYYDGDDSLTSSNGREADAAGDAASDRSSDSSLGSDYAYGYKNGASSSVDSSNGKRMNRGKKIDSKRSSHGSEGSRAHGYAYENDDSDSPTSSEGAIADNAEQDSNSYDGSKANSDVGSLVGSGSHDGSGSGSVSSPDSESASYALGKYLLGSGSGPSSSSAATVESSSAGSGSVADAGYKTAEEVDGSGSEDEDGQHSRAGSSDTGGSGEPSGSGSAYYAQTDSESGESVTTSAAAYANSGSGSGDNAEGYADSESSPESYSATTSEGAYYHSGSGSGSSYPIAGSSAQYYNADSSDEGAAIAEETSGDGPLSGDGSESTYEHLYGYVHDGDEDLNSEDAEETDYIGGVDGSYSPEKSTAMDYYYEKTDVDYQVAQDMKELDTEQSVGSEALYVDETTNEYDTSAQGDAYADGSYAQTAAYDGKYQGSTMYDDKEATFESALGSIDDAFEAGQADYMSHEGSAYGTKEDDYYQKTQDYVMGDYQASDQDYVENKLYGEEYDAYYGEQKMSSYAQGIIDYVASYIGDLEDSLEDQEASDEQEYGSVASAIGSKNSDVDERMSALYGDASDQGSSVQGSTGEMFLAMNVRAKSKIRRKSPKFYRLLAEMRKARN